MRIHEIFIVLFFLGISCYVSYIYGFGFVIMIILWISSIFVTGVIAWIVSYARHETSLFNLFRKPLSPEKYKRLCNQAEELINQEKYLQAYKLYDELEKTQHGAEVPVCKQICKVLSKTLFKTDFKVIDSIGTKLFLNPWIQSKIPAIVYRKIIEYIENEAYWTNFEECFFLLTCYHRCYRNEFSKEYLWKLLQMILSGVNLQHSPNTHFYKVDSFIKICDALQYYIGNDYTEKDLKFWLKDLPVL